MNLKWNKIVTIVGAFILLSTNTFAMEIPEQYQKMLNEGMEIPTEYQELIKKLPEGTEIPEEIQDLLKSIQQGSNITDINNKKINSKEIEFEVYATKLSSIGVFKGTGEGFDLDKQPTRLQGLTMLIRLIGAEQEALALKDEPTKFKDVPLWGRGYVNYAYKKGLTNGISDDEFGSDNILSSKSFTTFVLRALNYNDSVGDFSWNNANQFAKTIGLVDETFENELTNDTFLRGHLAKISFLALQNNIKRHNVTLLEYLVDKGSIDKEKAIKLKNNSSTIEIIEENNDEETATDENNSEEVSVEEEANKDLPISTPTDENIDESKLQAMESYVENNNKYDKLDAVLITRNGKIVYEKYYNSTNKDYISPVFSVTKSVTSMLTGIAEDKGLLKSDDKVLDYFDIQKLSNVDENKKAMEIKHLLTMQSGLKWNDRNDIAGFIINAMIPFSNFKSDEYLLNLEMVAKPGTVYEYNSAHGNIVDSIIYKQSGLHLDDFAKQYLFKPLGIENYKFEKGIDGITFGGKGLHLTARDMAKLGILMQNKGMYNNQQIISNDWVEISTTPLVRTGDDKYSNKLDYAYSWRVDDFGYRADGAGGQRINIYDDKNLVVVFKTATDIAGQSTDTMQQDLNYLINNYILGAAK